MVRILIWLANKVELFNRYISNKWNGWLKKIKM